MIYLFIKDLLKTGFSPNGPMPEYPKENESFFYSFDVQPGFRMSQCVVHAGVWDLGGQEKPRINNLLAITPAWKTPGEACSPEGMEEAFRRSVKLLGLHGFAEAQAWLAFRMFCKTWILGKTLQEVGKELNGKHCVPFAGGWAVWVGEKQLPKKLRPGNYGYYQCGEETPAVLRKALQESLGIAQQAAEGFGGFAGACASGVPGSRAGSPGR